MLPNFFDFIDKKDFPELIWRIVVNDLVVNVKQVNRYLTGKAVYFAMARMGVVAGKIVVDYRIITYTPSDDAWEKIRKAHSSCVDQFTVTDKGVKYRMVGEELSRQCEEMMMTYEILVMNIDFLRSFLGLDDEITSIRIVGKTRLDPRHHTWTAKIRLELTSRVLEKNARITLKPVTIIKPSGERIQLQTHRFPRITKKLLKTIIEKN